MTFDYGVAKVRPATLADAEALAPRLRKADLQELEASSRETPLALLQHGVTNSLKAYAIETPRGVAALFGVVPSPQPSCGNVWLLASDDLLTIRTTFLRHSRSWLRELFRDFRLLGNLVDQRNTVHVQWLRWLGFQFYTRHPHGLNGEVFIEFTKLRDE